MCGSPVQRIAEYVSLPLEGLLQFFGEVALTPFGPDEDCAPKAQRILEWIALNRVTQFDGLGAGEKMDP